MVSWCFYPFGSRFLSICHFHPWIFAPCYKLNFVPLKRYVEVFLPLEPVNVTLFGSRVFAGIIELRCGHTGLGWALNSVSLEKEMATHSSILAWRTPWMEKLGGLQSMGPKDSDKTERLHFHFNSVWLVFLWEEKGHRNRGKRYVTMETGITLFTRQVMPTIDSNHQKPGERRETDSPSEPLEGTTLADTLTSDFWPPALR